MTRERIDPPARREPEPWFRKAFGPFYQELYGHRDDAEARPAVDLLLRRLPVAEAAGVPLPILDIASGAGRHLLAFAERGHAAFGLDLSPHLLAGVPDALRGFVVRGDMRRLPFRAGVFGAAISMFTSFGYFRDLGENRAVLAEAARVIAPGGGLAVDYFNARTTIEGLVPSGRRTVGRYEVTESRRVSDSGEVPRIIKTVEIADDGGTVETFREEVMVLRPEMIDALLDAAGFDVLLRFGDYSGAPFDEARSPRCLTLARKRTS